MINTKCIELDQRLFKPFKGRFSELEIVDMTESAEDHEHIWVHVVMPDDAAREIAVRELASELSMDILLEQGYHITVSTATDEERQHDFPDAKKGYPPTHMG